MKKQVAQFVPYTDTLGEKTNSTVGLNKVLVGGDGTLFTKRYCPLVAVSTDNTAGGSLEFMYYNRNEFLAIKDNFLSTHDRSLLPIAVSLENAYGILLNSRGLYIETYFYCQNMQTMLYDGYIVMDLLINNETTISYKNETNVFKFISADILGIDFNVEVSSMLSGDIYLNMSYTVTIMMLVDTTTPENVSYASWGTKVGDV